METSNIQESSDLLKDNTNLYPHEEAIVGRIFVELEDKYKGKDLVSIKQGSAFLDEPPLVLSVTKEGNDFINETGDRLKREAGIRAEVYIDFDLDEKTNTVSPLVQFQVKGRTDDNLESRDGHDWEQSSYEKASNFGILDDVRKKGKKLIL
jgi:hypothetical protein